MQSIVGDCTAWARVPASPRTGSPAQARKRRTTNTDLGTRRHQVEYALVFKQTRPADFFPSDLPQCDKTKHI